MGKDKRGSRVDREASSRSQVDEEWAWEAREMGGTSACHASEATVGLVRSHQRLQTAYPFSSANRAVHQAKTKLSLPCPLEVSPRKCL